MVGDAVGALVRQVGAPAVARSVRALADRIARYREAARATTPAMKLAALLVGLMIVMGCEKSGSSGKASGALSADQMSMVAHLPKGSVALFGGNYMRFQNYLANSPALAKAMAMVDKRLPGTGAWMDCWANEMPKLEMVGSVKIDAATRSAAMQFVMKGVELSTVEKCTAKASFHATVDPDGKFMSYEMPSELGTMKSGYLVLADGTLYSRQAFSFGGGPKVAVVTRADLEADVAALQQGTAQSDTALIAEAAKLDRTKSMWFVGSGANTPASDKLGVVRGTIDIENGITVDLSAEVKDGAAADRIEKMVVDAKKQTDRLPGGIGELVKALQLSRSGDTLHFVLAMTNKQLTDVFDQLAPLMGAGRP